MKKDDLLQAIGEIDEKYIAEYMNEKKKMKRRFWVRCAAVAASFVIIVTGTVTAYPYFQNNKVHTEEPTPSPSTDMTDSTDATQIPEEPGEFAITSIEAEERTGNYISTDTRFLVTCENGTVEKVREHLFISAAPEYTVEPTEQKDVFTVSLKKPLSGSQNVSLSYVNNGTTDYSWAFETENKLTVDGTYPRNGAVGVDLNSVFELEFSGTVTGNLFDYVSFEPDLKGEWEVLGRIARFTPAQGLSAETVYRVTVQPGLSADTLTLENGCTVLFSTYPDEEAYRCTADTITVDGINTYKPGEQIVMRYIDSTYNSPAPIGRVAIEQFASAEDMIACAAGATPETAELPDAAFTTRAMSDNYYDILLTDILPAGYYRARVYAENGAPLFDWIIQIHPITAFVSVTERDLLVWTADGSGLAADIPVRFSGTETVTDANGIALLRDATDGSGDNGYVMVGSADAPLALAVKNYTHDTYPGAFIYTDKPQYKNTDTIKVWGCIPASLFYEAPTEQFTVVLGNSERRIDVVPDKDGSFGCDIPLVDYADGRLVLTLEYKGKQLTSRIVLVENYELQNYTFTVEAEKNYVTAGENYEFDVMVTHVSGVAVAGKKVRANYRSKEYYSVSDATGLAHFSLPVEKVTSISNNNSAIQRKYVNITNGDIEEPNYNVTSHTFYGVYAPIYADAAIKDGQYQLRAYSINLDGVTKIEPRGDSYNVVGDPIETTASLTVSEEKNTRTITGTEFDKYTKTTVPIYSDTETTVKTVDKKTLNLTDGTYTLDLAQYPLHEPTETEATDLVISANVRLSDEVEQVMESTDYHSFATSAVFLGNGSFKYYPYVLEHRAMENDSYYLTRYVLQIENEDTSSSNTYNVGDRIPLVLKDDMEKTVSAGGTVLRLVYGNSFIDTALMRDTDDLSYTCTEDALGGACISGAYYNGGKFYRLPSACFEVAKESRTLDIELTPDKDTYSPGDTVTLTVGTKKADGTPISATVNLSVVNDAVFGDDLTDDDIVGDVLVGRARRFYSAVTTRDYDICRTMGGYGGGGGTDIARTNFADTAYFSTLTTDADGRARVTFTLPDTVTTWRITAHAASSEIYYGSSIAKISAALDFFLQSTPPVGVKESDDLVLNASGILNGGTDTVNYEFTVKETGETMNVSAQSGSMASVNLGKLPQGKYNMRIRGVCGDASDTIEYPVEIVHSTQQTTVEEELSLTETPSFTPSAYPVNVEIYTEQTSRYKRYFSYLKDTVNARLDVLLAGREAHRQENILLSTNNPVPELSISNDYINSGRMLRALPEAESDRILTAMFIIYTPDAINNFTPDPSQTIGESLSRREIIGNLMLRAARNEAVLADLAQARVAADGDPYLQAVIACAYAFAGDYTSAGEVYRSIAEPSKEDGGSALYALAATFIDKENAAQLIDKALEEDPSQLYLPFTVLSYLKNNSVKIAKEDTVTLTMGDFTQTVKINGIKPAVIILPEGDLSEIKFDSSNPDLRVNYRYYTDTLVTTGRDGEFITSLEGTPVKYQQVTLLLDLRYLPVRCGQIRVALPNGLKYCGDSYVQSYVGVSAKNGYLNVSVGENADDTVRIPLIVANEGNYTFESAVFVADGVRFCSQPFEFTAALPQ